MVLKVFHFLSYLFIRLIFCFINLLPFKMIHFLGRSLGRLAYYIFPKMRKRALSNLALATKLNLSKKAIISFAKESLENFFINLFEYPKWQNLKNIKKRISCENPKEADELFSKKQGMIFFCGHQANWETLFLEGNLHMRGVAVAKPFKNPYLYRWIVSIREKTNGKIIEPEKAIGKCLKALREGTFVGIVGDQGKPDSGFISTFFERRCFTSPTPALLSYKTNSPILVATLKRENGKYIIHYSAPIWPNLKEDKEKEVKRLMDTSLLLLEQSIENNLGQWLWQHNRYKQQLPHRIYKTFRHETLAIFLDEENFSSIYPHLKTLYEIFENHFIFLYLPKKYAALSFPKSENISFYENINELFIKDYRFKLIFNFTKNKKISTHFKKLSAFKSLTKKNLLKLSLKKDPKVDPSDFSKIFTLALCRKSL